MKKNTAISVILSVYNPDPHQLSQAIRSIIGQTFRDWEMILYNDGSDREYDEVFADAAEMDGRIRYIFEKENHGLAYGLNRCLKESRGSYIARMDGDDISHPQRFRKMYDFLESHPQYQWVGCNTALIDADGKWGSRRMPEIPDRKDFLKYSPYIHPSVIFRREVLDEIQGYRISRKGEDYELFMRLHARGYQGYNLQEELFSYREAPEAVSRQKWSWRLEEAGIRLHGFAQLRLLKPAYTLYIVKPLLAGLVPRGSMMKIKKQIRKEMHVERYEGSTSKTV